MESRVGYYRETLKTDFESGDKRFRPTLLRTIVDFIASMTDDFALHQYEILYGTSKPNHY